jgi:hypothetical protein
VFTIKAHNVYKYSSGSYIKVGVMDSNQKGEK